MRSAFVVGCGHSGTSIMLRLLGAHPDVYAVPGETNLFLNGNEEIWAKALAGFDAEAAAQGKTIWIEKTPRHVLRMAKILKLRPDAQFIGMVRLPLDAACSYRGRGMVTFEVGLQRWLKYNKALLPHKDKPYMHFIHLEALIANPQTICAEALSFLDLSPCDLTAYHKEPVVWYVGSEQGVRRNAQINEPLFSNTDRTHELTPADRTIIARYQPQLYRMQKLLARKASK